MAVHFDAHTSWGKRTVWLTWLFFGFLAVFFILVQSGQRGGGGGFWANPRLTIPFVLSVSCGMASGITGLIAWTKQQERSLSVVISLLISLFVWWWILSEIFSPH